MKHPDYRPQRTEEHGDDLIVYPVDGYGSQEQVRSLIWQEKPDILWFMTDPRFYDWLWNMSNEIRPLMPMVYYHVWDNYPYPTFNKLSYESNDVVLTISKVTDDIVRTVAPNVESKYMPHAVNSEYFKKLSKDKIEQMRELHAGPNGKDKFICFWNNRNARRKQTGSLVWWFNEWAEKVGPENVRLIMHTDPTDQQGQNIETMLHELNALDGRIQVSKVKVDAKDLAIFYNMSDCTINISDAEGFGLATLESLACGTPIIVNMTGGLQEQVTDGKQWFGVGIEPCSKAVIGSQQVPFIYEDRISKEDFHAALDKMYNMSKEERETMGDLGSKHVEKNYNFQKLSNEWVKTMDEIHEKYGSWENRKEYDCWTITEVKL